MQRENVKAILHDAPHAPGVYLMKDAKARIFYVGKAKDLHNRMHQYINPTSDQRAFVLILDTILKAAEFIITRTEKEALILESNLIKKHRPRFNVRINDDSNYFSIRINLQEDYPRLEVIRRRKKDNALYFGPYSSAKKARRMLRLINKHFSLRDCTLHTLKTTTRPCVRHQMHRCPAPCAKEISREEYHREVRRVRLFLEGKQDSLIKELEEAMRQAAENLEYEQAAILRDRIEAVKGSLEGQFVELRRMVDWDALGLFREGELATIGLVRIRQGRLVSTDAMDIACRALPDSKAIEGFVKQYYETLWPLPEAILLPVTIEDALPFGQMLTQKKAAKVSILSPKRGDKKTILDMASENAEHAFRQTRSAEALRRKELDRLQRTLKLANLPERIECYDISNFQGSLAVGSMVCFIDGLPDKNEYRRYKIKTIEGADDFAMMREVLTRRLSRGLSEDNLPDLIVIDGGKGQLNAAALIMKDLGVEGVDLASLAKSRLKDEVGFGEEAEAFEGKMRTPERVFLPGRKNPVIIKPGTGELFLLQRLRDEAHRFAIAYHRKLRSKQHLRSSLLDVPGIGEKRARALLNHFGSLKKLRQADKEAIENAPGMTKSLAETLFRFFETTQKGDSDKQKS